MGLISSQVYFTETCLIQSMIQKIPESVKVLLLVKQNAATRKVKKKTTTTTTKTTLLQNARVKSFKKFIYTFSNTVLAVVSLQSHNSILFLSEVYIVNNNTYKYRSSIILHFSCYITGKTIL